MTEPRSDVLVFFGVTGDLAYKKIFPALHAMAKRGVLDIPVVGIGSSDYSVPQLIERARASITEYGGGVDEHAFAAPRIEDPRVRTGAVQPCTDGRELREVRGVVVPVGIGRPVVITARGVFAAAYHRWACALGCTLILP